MVLCSGQQQFQEKPRGPKLLDAVMATLRNDGSVLMPVDTAGRVLEIMLLLEKHWAVHRLSYPIALLSPVAYNTLEFAKSQLEWMNEQVAKEFENSRDKDNPFSMRYAAPQHHAPRISIAKAIEMHTIFGICLISSIGALCSYPRCVLH